MRRFYEEIENEIEIEFPTKNRESRAKSRINKRTAKKHREKVRRINPDVGVRTAWDEAMKKEEKSSNRAKTRIALARLCG